MRKDIDAKRTEITQWLHNGVPRMEIARRLRCKYDTLKKRIDTWGLSHLKNQPSKDRRKPGLEVHASNYLHKGSTIKSHQLKNRLWRDGYKERKCEQCGITEWQGQPAPLELDHVDGDKYNNELENLRILCANCHALTPTNSGKNIGSYNKALYPNLVEEAALEAVQCQFESDQGHNIMIGDCMATCLDCFGGGINTVGCVCEKRRMSMCYHDIQQARKKAGLIDF